MDTPVFDAIVLGGGISALAAAWRLQSRGRRPLLVCDSEDTGGVIRTERRDEWLLEIGPNSYASFGSEEEELLSEIGLADRVLRKPIRTTDRYIWHSGKLHRVPTGLLSFAGSSLLPFTAKLNILSGMLGRYEPPQEDVSIGRFFRNLFGDVVVDTLIRPALAGIYAADADRISLEAAFPALSDGIRGNRWLPNAIKTMKKSRPRGKPSGPRSLTSFPDGLAELPRAMTDGLRRKDVPMELGARKVSVSRTENEEAWLVSWEGGSAQAPAVILSTPVPGTRAILENAAPGAAELISRIEHAPLTVVHAGVRTEDLRMKPEGFGFLARRGEGVGMLGAIWSSSIFPGRAPAGRSLFTCMFGGDIDPEVTDWPDKDLEEQLIRDLRTTMGYKGKRPELVNIMTWKPALPLYRPGHAALIRDFRAALPKGIQVTTNWTGGISIPDRIRGGWKAADAITGATP